jgi:hypothetical protein
MTVLTAESHVSLKTFREELLETEREATLAAELDAQRDAVEALPGEWRLSRSPLAGDVRFVARRGVDHGTGIQFESADSLPVLLDRIGERTRYEARVRRGRPPRPTTQKENDPDA